MCAKHRAVQLPHNKHIKLLESKKTPLVFVRNVCEDVRKCAIIAFYAGTYGTTLSLYSSVLKEYLT